MKKNYYYKSVLAAMMLSFGLNANSQDLKTFDLSVTNYEVPTSKSRKVVIKENVPTKLPQVITKLKFNGTEWTPVQMNKRTFDEKLLCVEEEITDFENYGAFPNARLTYKYNENDFIVENLKKSRISEQEDFENEMFMTYTYDNICKDVQLSNEMYLWDAVNNEWKMAENTEMEVRNFYTDVKRNEAGNVCMKQFWLDDNHKTPGLGYYYTYGTDNAGATEVVAKVPDDKNELTEMYRWENVKWHKTNGQYLKTSNNIFFAFLNDPDNMVESYNLYSLSGGNVVKDADCKNEFDDQDRLTVSLIMDYFGTNIVHLYSYDLSPEGNKSSFSSEWKDLNGNGTYDEGEAVLGYTNSIQNEYYDTHHNITKREIFEYNEETGKIDYCAFMTTWDYTYLEDGTISEVVETTYKHGKEVEKIKYMYEEFCDQNTNGIDEATGKIKKLIAYEGCVVALNLEGVGYTISDLQGRVCGSGVVTDSKISLSNLAAGMYIVNVDGITMKVMKK